MSKRQDKIGLIIPMQKRAKNFRTPVRRQSFPDCVLERGFGIFRMDLSEEMLGKLKRRRRIKSNAGRHYQLYRRGKNLIIFYPLRSISLFTDMSVASRDFTED